MRIRMLEVSRKHCLRGLGGRCHEPHDAAPIYEESKQYPLPMSSSIDSEYLGGFSDPDVSLYVQSQNQEVTVDPFQSSPQPDDGLQPTTNKKRKRGAATRAITLSDPFAT